MPHMFQVLPAVFFLQDLNININNGPQPQLTRIPVAYSVFTAQK